VSDEELFESEEQTLKFIEFLGKDRVKFKIEEEVNMGALVT
jgi:hypothetical protein